MTLIYKPNEVMKRFNLKESVYKKYIAALEKEGYLFEKNQQGHRIFSERDIKTFERFLELIRYDGMTIELVAKKIGEINSHNVMTEEKQESHNVMTLFENAVRVALETQEKQLMTKFNSQLKETQEQLNRIETRANDRDQILMQSIRESQEVKKLLLEVKEQIAATKEEKKSWWKRFFNA
jgi:DNA-binding transcriptional MerR regulator